MGVKPACGVEALEKDGWSLRATLAGEREAVAPAAPPRLAWDDGVQVYGYRFSRTRTRSAPLSGVVKFTEASSIALHTMAILAADPDRHVTIHEVAARLPVSENHLAKVLQRLARAGLVESVRGPGGGFSLEGDPTRITLLDVYEAIEGKLEIASCLFDPAQCCGTCILGPALHDANALVHARLAGTRLADLTTLFPPPAPALVAPPTGPRGKARPGAPAGKRP